MPVDKHLRIGIILCFVAIGGPVFLLPANFPTCTMISTIGALLALVGVIGITRPVWRAGFFTWIMRNTFTVLREAGSGRLGDSGDGRFDGERWNDETFQQVFGPGLIGLGTALNGFSGYFA